jgi:RNA polymerase sigma factor (sigma-70 family)
MDTPFREVPIMADASPGAVVRYLCRVVPPTADPRDDRELLAAFAARHDHAAFAVLVRRHGPLVLNVCRRVLRQEQDAEDAFQATFLVLVAKASSLPAGASVAGFLHGVAYRLALKVRREAVRRRGREARVRVPASSGDAAAEPSWREVQAVLEEEIQRLPEKYRLPFALCHLEGLSRAEAGRQLGLKEGTVWSRLSQARARLQERLSRRGIALSAVLAAAAVSNTSVGAGLVETVVQGARQWGTGSPAGGVSGRVALLARAGVKTLAGKTKVALAGLVALLAVGAGGVICQALTARPPEAPAETAPRQASAAAAKKPEPPRVGTDRHGDPLPDGALARLGTVRWRHGAFALALAYSPDGKMIVTSGVGRALVLWDAATGKELRVFPSHGQPRGVAFSPDGKLIATTEQLGQLWDVATGKMLCELKNVQGGVHALAFAPDGRTLATANGDGAVHLWDPASGEEKRRLDGGRGGVHAVAYSPDGTSLASGGNGGVIHLWDAAGGKERRRFAAAKNGTIWSVVFSPDGKHLAVGSNEDTPRLWDVATGREVRAFGGKQGPFAPLAFSPDGKLLASGYPDGTLGLWDVAGGGEKRHWRAGPWAARSLAFSPDGKTLTSAEFLDGGGGVRLWEVPTGRERHAGEGHHGIVRLLRFAEDGKSLISAGCDQRVLWWDVTTQTPRRQFAWTTQSLGSFALSPDGNTVAAADRKTSEVWLWDVPTGKAVRLPGKQPEWIHDGIHGVAFSPDGRLVASAGWEDDGIHIWDVREGKEVRLIKNVTNSMGCLCFSPDGTVLACGVGPAGNAGGGPTLRLWEVSSGKECCSVGVRTPVRALAFSGDGKVLAGGQSGPGEGAEMVVCLWDAMTGKELGRHTGHGEGVGAIAFSPDGKLVASGGCGDKDNSVHVWEAATGRLIRRFEGHHSWVSAVTFAPDGLTVASGAGDSTILLWDITGRQQGGKLRGAARLTPRALDACWETLASADAARAYDSVWVLVAAAEQAAPFLAKHLHPVPRPDAKSVDRLLADLNSDEFVTRRKATEELGELGDTIIPHLRRALEGKPALEMRRRVQQLLDQSREWNAERLRDHRAIQVLEHLGTRRAKEVLEGLAGGAPEARRTEEAKAALQRLGL